MKLKSTLIVLSLIAAPAFASDQLVSKTREQVRAELAQAMQSGDMLASGESGLTLKQLNPGAYPATASAQATKSRDQVRAELEQAIRTGDILVGGESGAKLNEVMPDRYPVVANASSKTRAQVKSELHAPSAKAKSSPWEKTPANSMKSILTDIRLRAMLPWPPPRAKPARPLGSKQVLRGVGC